VRTQATHYARKKEVSSELLWHCTGMATDAAVKFSFVDRLRTRSRREILIRCHSH
jgi:hypothetical protein